MKYIISWDIGRGYSYDVIDVDSEEEAYKIAFLRCKEEFEMTAEYVVENYSEELAYDYGLIQDMPKRFKP